MLPVMWRLGVHHVLPLMRHVIHCLQRLLAAWRCAIETRGSQDQEVVSAGGQQAHGAQGV